jgi:alkylation response protein AidB-like acyl-CoA dehydrogenase
MSAGLITMEMARGDGSMVTFLVVHGGLAMKSIFFHGSEEQKQKWLPPMARLEKIGALALTEPEHGSDSAKIEHKVPLRAGVAGADRTRWLPCARREQAAGREHL